MNEAPWQQLEQTCGACPSQWDALTVEGERVYVRYRLGWLTVEIDDHEVLSKQLGDEYDGLLSTDEMLGHTAELRAQP